MACEGFEPFPAAGQIRTQVEETRNSAPVWVHLDYRDCLRLWGVVGFLWGVDHERLLIVVREGGNPSR